MKLKSVQQPTKIRNTKEHCLFLVEKPRTRLFLSALECLTNRNAYVKLYFTENQHSRNERMEEIGWPSVMKDEKQISDMFALLK